MIIQCISYVQTLKMFNVLMMHWMGILVWNDCHISKGKVEVSTVR